MIVIGALVVGLAAVLYFGALLGLGALLLRRSRKASTVPLLHQVLFAVLGAMAVWPAVAALLALPRHLESGTKPPLFENVPVALSVSLAICLVAAAGVLVMVRRASTEPSAPPHPASRSR